MSSTPVTPMGANFSARRSTDRGDGCRGGRFREWKGVSLLLPATSKASNFSRKPGDSSRAIRLYGMVYLILGIQMIPGFFFQGIGRGLPASVLTLARSIFILLPLILLLPRVFGVTGIWLSYPITDVLSLLISVGWMANEFRRQGIDIRWWKAQPER